MCQEHGIENEIIPRIASGFAGGIGNTGSVCGAVVGAVMAIGLLRGRDGPIPAPDAPAAGADELRATLESAGEAPEEDFECASWGLAREFRRRFEAEMETISCRELTGADLTTEEGRTLYMKSDEPLMVCFPAIGLAYKLVLDLLRESA